MQEFLNIPFIAISGKYGLTIKAASISFEMSDNCYATAQVSFEAYYQKNIEKKRGKRIVIALYDEQERLFESQQVNHQLSDSGFDLISEHIFYHRNAIPSKVVVNIQEMRS